MPAVLAPPHPLRPVIEPAELEDLSHVCARVHRRHPAASAARVRRHVEEAAEHFREARVRLYLPILIERAAGQSLSAAEQSGPDASEPATVAA